MGLTKFISDSDLSLNATLIMISGRVDVSHYAKPSLHDNVYYIFQEGLTLLIEPINPRVVAGYYLDSPTKGKPYFKLTESIKQVGCNTFIIVVVIMCCLKYTFE